MEGVQSKFSENSHGLIMTLFSSSQIEVIPPFGRKTKDDKIVLNGRKEGLNDGKRLQE